MEQGKCIEVILSAIDDIYAGIHYYKKHYGEKKKITEGLVMVYKKLEKRLKKDFNVVLYIPKIGETFDAEKHEAVDLIAETIYKEGAKYNKVIIQEVLSVGAIEIETNKVIRPAKVIVAAVAQ